LPAVPAQETQGPIPAPGTDSGGSRLALRAVANERFAAAIVSIAFPATSLNTIQAYALQLVAKRLQSSLAVEGELPDNGLAAYDDDLLLTLACQIFSNASEDETAEDIFARATTAATTVEEMLVDEGWRLWKSIRKPKGSTNRSHACPGQWQWSV